MESIRLTQTVAKGGCAAKVAASELREILANVVFPPAPPELLVDGRHFDDAAIFRISDSVAIVQTLDFFTPILDSPFDFGRVAAANALSDVYAMGGRPQTALAILAFPLATLPREVIIEVMRGGSSVLTRARTALAGGHSIDDDTLKFGLSVNGIVHPDRIWANTGARPGDRLLLTKGLGTGALTAALKRSAITEAQLAPAIESMVLLNDVVDHIEGLENSIHAATDITGFGFSGHATQLAVASRVSCRVDFKSLPQLPGALEFLREGFLTKAHKTNQVYTSGRLAIRGLASEAELLLHDPQTSGGLLLAVEASSAERVLARLKPVFPMAALIGSVEAPGSAAVTVE